MVSVDEVAEGSDVAGASKRRHFVRRGEKRLAHLASAANGILVESSYLPELVAWCKERKSRYQPTDKRWLVPREYSDQLHNTLEGFRYTIFTPAPFSLLAAPYDSTCAAAARERYLKNPFAVAIEDIAVLDLDVVFRLGAHVEGVFAVPRLTKAIGKILEHIEGVFLTPSERGYSVPAGEIPTLLKLLRDGGFRAGVEAEAGRLLAQSAEMRRKVLGHEVGRTIENLRAGLLVPRIDSFVERGSTNFVLEGFPACELQKLVGKRGVRASVAIDARGIARLIREVQTNRRKVYFSDAAEDALAELAKSSKEKVSGDLSSHEAVFLGDTTLWTVDHTKRATLLLAESFSLRSTVLQVLRDAKQKSDSPIVLPDSKLLGVFNAVQRVVASHGESIPTTKEFEDLLSDIAERAVVRDRIRSLNELADKPLETWKPADRSSVARLFPHQRVAVGWLTETPEAFLGDDMGLGKTLSVLTAFHLLQQRREVDKLLVVCPNSLTRNWLREIAQWFPNLHAQVISGDRATKQWMLRVLQQEAVQVDVMIVNYESARLDYVRQALSVISSRTPLLLCLDESQRIKNPASKTFKGLLDVAKRARRKVLLSGTPTPKDITDIWAQMMILDGGKRLGTSYRKLLERVAELGNSFSALAIRRFKPEEVEESISRVHEVLLRRRKEEVVNLPEKIFTIRDIELGADQRARFDEVRKDLLLRVTTMSGGEYVREITSILEQYLRAVQIASNPRLVDPNWDGIPGKFLELDDIVNEVVAEQEKKLVVWTNYLGDVRELVERYAKFGAKPFSGEVTAAHRHETIQQFQTGDCNILVAAPAAGGVGITLTAAQTAVYLDKTWNAEHWLQSVDRLHRIGQKGTVTIVSLLATKIDELIHYNLLRKEQKQRELLGDDGKVAAPSREELLAALRDEPVASQTDNPQPTTSAA